MPESLPDWGVPNGEQTNALVLVAHTDDETIFCGGLMLSKPSWKWTVISMTLQDDAPDRLQEFQTAMDAFKEYGVNIETAFSLKKHDSGNPWDKLSLEQKLDWTETLRGLGLKPDIVFTHNSKGGEYGNFLHMETSLVAQVLYSNVWEFVYPGKTKVSDLEQPTGTIVNKVELSDELLAKKRAVFDRAYSAQAPGLEKDLGELMDYELRKGPEIFTKP